MREVCHASPDYKHHVAGDHHGDEHTCTWCGAEVVLESGRLLAWPSMDPTPRNGFEGHHA